MALSVYAFLYIILLKATILDCSGTQGKYNDVTDVDDLLKGLDSSVPKREPEDAFNSAIRDAISKVSNDFPKTFLTGVRFHTTYDDTVQRKHHSKHDNKEKKRKKVLHMLKQSIRKHKIQNQEHQSINNHTAILKDFNKDIDLSVLLLDHRIWIGVVTGSVLSMTLITLGFVLFSFYQKNKRKNNCVDLNNLSFCSEKIKDPVYVRLSQIHNPRKSRSGSQYVVSMMDKSNNFSICTDSSSSEEEIFNASDSRQFMSPHKSLSKISMTSTPVKLKSSGPTQTAGSPMRTRNAPVVTSPFASPITKHENSLQYD